VKKALKDLFIYIFAGGLSRLLPLVILPYMASRLNHTEFGIFSLFQLYLSLGSAILLLGLDQAAFRKTSERISTAEKHQVMGTALYTVLIMGTILTIASGLFHTAVNQLLFEGELTHPVVFVALFALIVSIDVLFITKFKAEQRTSEYLRLLLTRSLLFFLLMIILLESGLRLEAYFIALTVSELTVLLLMSPDIAAAMRRGFSPPLLQEMMKYGMPLFGVGFLLLLIYQFDHYLIKEYFGVEETGIYAYAYKFAAIISTFVLITNNVWMPRLFEKGISFAYDYLREYTAYILVTSGFFLLLLFSAFRLFPGLLIPAGFGQTPYLLTILGLGFLFYAHSQILDSILLNDHKTWLLFLFNSIALVCNIVLNLIFIPKYGMEAAAIITALSYLLLWLLILQYIVFRYRELSLIKTGLEGLLITIPFFLQLFFEWIPLVWIIFILLSIFIIIRNRELIYKLKSLIINISG